MKFRKKPVVIEAVKYATILTSLPRWVQDHSVEVWSGHTDPPTRVLEVHTLEGTMIANSGDWIIRGIKGEVYPCKPDIFEMTYEPVEDDPPTEGWDAERVT